MNSRLARRLILTGVVSLAGSDLALGADWPQWRGALQDGSAVSDSLEAAESLRLSVAWRRSLGSGYSSISVVADLGVTMASIGPRDWVVAFDVESGRERWRFDMGARFLGRSGSDDGPMSTPAITEGRVYALGPEGRFVALDGETGELIWEYDLRELGSEPDFYGYSTAPVIHGERVFLLAGGSDDRMLIAFDRANGEIVWKSGSDGALHHGPVVGTLGGVEQIVAPGLRGVGGFALDDGRRLWRHEFDEETVSGGVLPIDADRVLITRWESTHLLEVVPVSGKNGGGTTWTVREIWSSRDLSSTYAVPVRRGEHLYGFNRRFLVCVDLESGETKWKSRPPGGQGLIGVDEHLLIVADDGELVAVEASPDGYRETGRIGLFPRRRVMTPPSFAAERLFVRDLEELVAVDLSGSIAPIVAEAPTAPAGGGPLATLLARLVSVDPVDRTAALRELEERYSSTPVREAGEVHFLYRGDVPDLAIVGDMSGGHRELPMRRVGRSDWYHRSFPAPQAGRWEYRFRIFDEDRLDPLNPVRIETPEGARSVVTFGDARGEAGPPSCPGCSSGSIASHTIQSTVPDRRYDLSVYTPPGYEGSGERRYPVVVWAEGTAARDHGEIVAWLDGLIGRREIKPVVAVLLQLPEAAWWGQNRSRLAEIMTQDVVPFLEAEYRVSSAPEDRSVVMHGWSVMNMLLWSLEADIGNLAIQSPFLDAYFLDRAMAERASEAGLERAYVDWGEYDRHNPDWGLDVKVQARQLADKLRTSGAEVVSAETPGGANWTRWSAETGTILRLFHPAE